MIVVGGGGGGGGRLETTKTNLYLFFILDTLPTDPSCGSQVLLTMWNFGISGFVVKLKYMMND